MATVFDQRVNIHALQECLLLEDLAENFFKLFLWLNG